MKRMLLSLALLFVVGVSTFGQQPDTKPAQQKDPPAQPQAPRVIIVPGRPELKKEQLKACRQQAYSLLRNQYFPIAKLGTLKKPEGEVTDSKDLDAQITKMAQAFGDKYTRYISPTEDSKQLLEHILLGKRSSGVSVEVVDGKFVVDYVELGTPFYTHLRKGDVITKINDTDLKGKKLEAVDKLLAFDGEGSKVNIKGLDKDGKPLTAEVKESDAVAAGENVKLIGTTLYLRLNSFGDDDASEFMGEVSEKLAGKNKKVDAIVLDLRGNPGGTFDGVLMINSVFIKKGDLARQYQRQGLQNVESRYSIDGFPEYFRETLGKELEAVVETLQTKPMYVLTNRFTASSAEICSGALQDNKRAVVYGDNTFGKHVGYEKFDLLNGGTLMVTTMHWKSPNGRSAEGNGLTPDKLVVQPRGSKEDVQLDTVLKDIKDASSKNRK